MKTKTDFTAALILGLSIIHLPNVFGQGSLTPPPGPPAPMMKTLDQIEPRRIVNDANTPGDATAQYIISQPGSYYLTGNLAGDSGRHGIRVTASDVTLDLNGFALLGALDSRQGIVVEIVGALPHFALRRGVLRGWPEGGLNAAAVACALEDVRALGNGGNGLEVGAESHALGCTATGNVLAGLRAGAGSVVTRGVARFNGEAGIDAGAGSTVADCVAANNATGLAIGAGARAERCVADANTAGGFIVGDAGALAGCVARNNGVLAGPAGSGIAAGHGCQILNCTATANFKDGIEAGSGGMVRGCTVRGNGVNGISALNDLSVLDNNAEGNGGPDALDDPAQILLNGSGNRVEGNTTSNTAVTQRSIRADNGGNAIVRNRFRGPGSNLIVASGNTVGPIVTGGTMGTASNPFANLFY